MRKICVFTGTRAEYGLLFKVMELIFQDPDLDLQILVTGMHLSKEFGLTYKEIEKDGFHIDEKIDIMLNSDTPKGICRSIGLGIKGYSEALQRLKPDIVVLLGDRYEAFALAAAAMVCRVPAAHIHGGESTFGLIDEPIRHSITKMSHLHFTSTEEYRKRVIQLGEHPEFVHNVGALGTENIDKMKLLDKDALEKQIGFITGDRYLLITYHPVTLESASAEKQFLNLLNAIDSLQNTKMIFTKANADTDGRIINRMIDEYLKVTGENAAAFTAMGQLRYLSAMKYASAVVGNSSSGIIEAPSFRVPTVNIGDRQKGRLKADNVIDCGTDTVAIKEAIDQALTVDFRNSLKNMLNPFAQENTARRIVEVIKLVELNNILKKEFHDILH